MDLDRSFLGRGNIIQVCFGPLISAHCYLLKLVSVTEFESATFRAPRERSTRLSYTEIKMF